MKIKGYLFGLGIAMATLFTACDTDNMGAMFQETTTGAAFSFASQSVSLPATGYEGFDVTVDRANITEAATVAITATMADGSALPAEIQVPSELTFAAGEGSALLHVTVGDIKSGMNYQINISIDATAASTIDGAVTTKSITIYRDYIYKSIGMGQLTSEAYGDEAGNLFQKEVEIMKADDENINWYKAVGLYEEGYDVVIKVAEDGKMVTVENQAVTSDLFGYGAGSATATGTLENGVITLSVTFSCSAGSFNPTTEIITLP